MVRLRVNEVNYEVKAGHDATLLWVLREELGLTGTKFGCGAGLCGACTVQVDGEAERSCQLTLSDVEGKSIRTIEGLPPAHPVKRAWIREQVPQCGYCQPGQMMQAAALLAANPSPSDQEIRLGMDGNLCRCGTYNRIYRAILRAARDRRSP